MKSKTATLLVACGLLMMAAALLLVGYNLYDSHRAEHAAAEVVTALKASMPTAQVPKDDPESEDENLPSTEIEIPDHVLNPAMDMPSKTVDGQDYIGVLEFPDFGLTVPVMEDWSYPKLKMAPSRYAGSVYTDDLIVAAHNYRSHFGDIRYLSVGSAVIFTDMDGNEFRYNVVQKETLTPTAIDDMISGEWDLTLFTCTIGGASRMTVRCERIE